MRRAVDGVDLRGGISNEMPGDLHLATFASGVQDERIGATESKHVEALERNRPAERSGHTGNHVAKTWRFRDQARNRRQHVHRISLDHYWIHVETTAGSPSGARAQVETHQYNPSYMPVSTPARVAIVIAALVAVVVGPWWISPERRVHRLPADLASTLSHEEAEPNLPAITAVVSLQSHLTTDVLVDVDGSARRDAGGDEAADAHGVSIALAKADGRWHITSAHVLARDAGL